MYRLIKLTILVHLLPEIDGAITLNCGASSPDFPDSVTCSCKNSAGTGVEWWEDTNLVSNCFFSVNCSPNPSGYTFSVNQTEQMFIMTVNPYNYSDCQQFTCKDFSDTSIQQSQIPSTIGFDSTMSSVIAEPVSNNTSGDISITTSCISDYSDLIAKWYIVVDDTDMEYIPDKDIVIRQIDTTACIACNNESAATIKLGFQHEEAVDNDALEGHFRLELNLPDSMPLVRNTSNVYKVASFYQVEQNTTETYATKPKASNNVTLATNVATELMSYNTTNCSLSSSLSEINSFTTVHNINKQSNDHAIVLYIGLGIVVFVFGLVTTVYLILMKRNE